MNKYFPKKEVKDLDDLFKDRRKKIKDKFNRLKYVELRLLKIFDHICNKYKIDYSLAFGTLIGAIRHKGFIPWDDDIDVIMTLENYNLFLKHINELPSSVFFQTNKNDKIEMGPPFLAKLRDNYSKVEFGKEYHSGAYMDIFLLDRISSNKFISFFQKIFLILRKFFLTLEKKEDIFKDRIHFLKGLGRTILFLPKVILKKLNFSSHLEIFYSNFFKEKPKDNYYLHMFWFKMVIMKKEDIFPFKKILFEKKLFPIFKNPNPILEYFYGDYLKLPPKEKRIPDHLDLEKIQI